MPVHIPAGVERPYLRRALGHFALRPFWRHTRWDAAEARARRLWLSFWISRMAPAAAPTGGRFGSTA